MTEKKKIRIALLSLAGFFVAMWSFSIHLGHASFGGWSGTLELATPLGFEVGLGGLRGLSWHDYAATVRVIRSSSRGELSCKPRNCELKGELCYALPINESTTAMRFGFKTVMMPSNGCENGLNLAPADAEAVNNVMAILSR